MHIGIGCTPNQEYILHTAGGRERQELNANGLHLIFIVTIDNNNKVYFD